MHEHEHGEHCGCHAHHHAHDEHCGCGCHSHDADGIRIEHHMQDDACVVSGEICLEGDYALLRPRVSAQLEAVAAAVAAQGGIVGHVKAAAEVTSTELFSVTEVKAMAKTAPTQEIAVKMAAIVFAIEPEAVEKLVEQALRAIRG